MRLLLLLISASILFIPAVALAQEQDYQVVKSDKSESFVLPYTASNQNKDSPLVYTFETPKQPSWILSIQNNLSYVPSDDSKTIIRINEPAIMRMYRSNVILASYIPSPKSATTSQRGRT